MKKPLRSKERRLRLLNGKNVKAVLSDRTNAIGTLNHVGRGIWSITAIKSLKPYKRES